MLHAMEGIGEGSYCAEIPATASKSPQEVFILIGVSGNHPPVSGDQFGCDQIVAGQPVLPHKPAQTSAERKASNAGRLERAHRSCQTKFMRRPIKLGESRTSFSTR